MSKIIQVFAGYDPREEVGYHAFCSSVIDKASQPVSITPLTLKSLGGVYQGGQKDGTNAFIYSRFLIPYLMDYSGWALFVDGSDMICRGDIAELWAMRDPFKCVQVVKHDYKTKHQRKYVGTQMEAGNEDYPRKNWSSVMLMNCGHYDWRRLTPDVVEKSPGYYLHRLQFTEDRFIGELPKAWNWLSQEHGENPDAKLIHYSAGIPAFPHYKETEMAACWFDSHEKVNYAIK